MKSNRDEARMWRAWEADSSGRLEQLRRYLEKLAPGPVPDEARSEVLRRLIDFWLGMKAHSNQGTSAEKLWRAEVLAWTPPNLEFRLERHGAAVLGSSRANLHHWQVNIDTGQAEITRFGRRQLKFLGPRIDCQKLANDIARLIAKGENHEALKWIRPGEDVQVIASKIIPDNAPAQTVAGRRRRFHEALITEMCELGWENYKPVCYFRRKG